VAVSSHRPQRAVPVGTHGPVTRTCLVATTPGSGAGWLGDAMAATGVLGRPRPYFRPEDVIAWAGEWGVATDADLVGRYVPAAVTAAAAGGDLAAIEIEWSQLGWLLNGLRTVPGDGPPLLDPDLVAAWLPRPCWVHLRRRDTARAALTHWRALHRAARPAGPEPVGADPAPVDAAPTAAPDWREVRLIEGLLLAQDERWRRYFERGSITPLTFDVDDVAADPARALARIAAVTGVRLAGRSVPVPPPPPPDPDVDTWTRAYAEVRDALPLDLRTPVGATVAGSAPGRP
jgi:LPS sulfotransferase NodH